MQIEIYEPTKTWDWNTGLSYRYGKEFTTWGRTTQCDPTPAYRYPIEAIERGIEICHGIVKPIYPIGLYQLDHEAVERTNAWASYDRDHQTKEWYGLITVNAKRIPPHPAMGRYLVVHEYGHHIEAMLSICEGLEPHRDEIIKDYAEMRQLETQPYYGPGAWHATPGEVFANDFRIILGGTEIEYWPHPGIPHPYKFSEKKALDQFWYTAYDILKKGITD
jgi:hypothetical protein